MVFAFLASSLRLQHFSSCLAFDDADGVEGLEFIEGDAEGVVAKLS